MFPNEENNDILKIDLTIDMKKSIIKKIQAFESSGAIFSYNILKYRFDLKNLNFEFNTKEYEDIYIIASDTTNQLKWNLHVFIYH